MTLKEQIRLYRLMEKLNWFFHQEMHYLDREIAEQTARGPRGSVIRKSESLHTIFCGTTYPKKCRNNLSTRRKPCEYTDLLF